MAGIGQVQSVGFTDPYSAQALQIERKRRLAEALQAKAGEPLGNTEMVNGWAVQRSPLEGAGKLANAWSAKSGIEAADAESKALSKKYQDDLVSALGNASRAQAGTPASSETIMDETAAGGEGQQAQINAPAVPPNRDMMIQALMGHPATRPMALAQMQQDMQRQGFMQAGGAQGALSGALTGQQGVTAGAPAGAPAGFGGPAGGQPMTLWMQLDPTGKEYTKQLAKDHTEGRKPISTRYGVFTRDPANPNQFMPAGGASPPGALSYTFGPEGQPGLGMLPGQAEGIADLERAKQGAQQPFKTGTTKIPVSLPGGDQVAVELGPMQMEVYNRTGALPPEIAASLPGAQSAPGATSPANFPREGLSQLKAYGSKSLQILQGEAETLTANGQPVPPDLQREIQNAQKRAGGAYPRGAPPVGGGFATGAPVVGRGQTEKEQIRQTRQTSAGKTVDEAFAKDYVTFKTGGAQDAAKQMAQLQDVTKQLALPGADLTGPVRGSMPDTLQKFTAAGRNAIAMRERVEEVVQRSLRVILGAQFTEKEGERLIARAYNPSLGENENAVRVGRLLTQLKQAYAAKKDAAQYFEKNNTLSGWQGKLPAMSDFDPEKVTGASGDWKDL